MKYRNRLLALALLAAGGCTETTTPTSPVLEQSVFAALGGLAVGETLTLSGSAAQEVMVGGAGVAGDFVYIPFHASRTQGANLLVRVTGEDVGGGFSTQSALTPSAGGLLELPANAMASSELHEQLHARLNAASAANIPRFRRSLSRSAGIVPPVRKDLFGGNATVGQTVQINTNTTGNACTALDYRTGRVEAITDRAIVVGDINNPSGGFTRADYESFGEEYDDLVHPTVTRYFSEPTDIDDNDRVVIFFTRAVNELTEPGRQGYVGGFFYGRDVFAADGCPASNESEIFYVLAPDPNAEASHIVHLRDRVFQGAVSTIAHELQHLINFGRRVHVAQIQSNDQVELSWLDEGLSHIAEEVVFYIDAGVEPRSNISASDVQGNADLVRAINRFGIQNLTRYGLYLEDVTRESPTDQGDELETRGAAWSFLRYIADQTAQDDIEFFHGLVNTSLVGFSNLEAALDEDPLEWFRRWGVSVYTDDLVSGDGPPLLQQPSWDFRSLLPLLFDGAFPLQVVTLGSQPVELNIVSTSSGYVRFSGMPGEITRLTTTSGGAPPPESLRVTVVRTR